MLSLLKSELEIPIGEAILPGDLTVPPNAKGLVVFAHGSGSSRFSERNRYVAKRLVAAEFATLLFDLLTPAEDADYENRFDIELLTDRLEAAVNWVGEGQQTNTLPIGLFGASTGAAAALKVAARLGAKSISAVVSRGGRPDLAMDDLGRVHSPTLLVVGGADPEVLQLNQEALDELPGDTDKELLTVPGATHLFGEPGALEKVSDLAIGWFEKYLQPVSA